MLGFTVSQAPYRAICHRPVDGRDNRGALSSAIKPSPSAMTSRPGTMQLSASGFIGAQSCASQLQQACASLDDHGHPLAAPGAQAISPWSARHHRSVRYQARRSWTVSGRSWQALRDRSQVAIPMRSPPYHARASPALHLAPTQAVGRPIAAPALSRRLCLDTTDPAESSSTRRTGARTRPS
jgi:hypothetical protein